MNTDTHKRFSFTTPTPPELNITNLSIDNQPSDTEQLLPWVLWYLKKEVVGIGSIHTAEAKMLDLQKFINYFHYHNKEGGISSWDKPFTYAFIEKLRDNYEVSTIKRIMATLSNFTRFLERKKAIDYDDNPVRGVKTPRSSPPTPKSLLMRSVENNRVISEGEEVFEKLMNAAQAMININQNKRQWPYRNLAIISTLYYTGLRVSELCNLTYSQLEKDDISGGYIFKDVICKGNKERDVYLIAKGTSYLDDYIHRERANISGPLFTTFYGKKLTRQYVGKIIKKIAKAAQLSEKDTAIIETSPHRFRHERAYKLLQGGLSVSDVAEELGHASIQYVGLYTRRSDDERYRRLNEIG